MPTKRGSRRGFQDRCERPWLSDAWSASRVFEYIALTFDAAKAIDQLTPWIITSSRPVTSAARSGFVLGMAPLVKSTSDRCWKGLSLRPYVGGCDLDDLPDDSRQAEQAVGELPHRCVEPLLTLCKTCLEPGLLSFFVRRAIIPSSPVGRLSNARASGAFLLNRH